MHLQTTSQDSTICPGDYLIGDSNGVVCLPKGLAEKVVALMNSQILADARIANDIKEGKKFGEASRERRAIVKRGEDV